MKPVEIFWAKYPQPPRMDVIYNNIMDQFRQEPLLHYPFLYDLMTNCYFAADDDDYHVSKTMQQNIHQLQLKVSQFVNNIAGE